MLNIVLANMTFLISAQVGDADLIETGTGTMPVTADEHGVAAFKMSQALRDALTEPCETPKEAINEAANFAWTVVHEGQVTGSGAPLPSRFRVRR